MDHPLPTGGDRGSPAAGRGERARRRRLYVALARRGGAPPCGGPRGGSVAGGGGGVGTGRARRRGRPSGSSRVIRSGAVRLRARTAGASHSAWLPRQGGPYGRGTSSLLCPPTAAHYGGDVVMEMGRVRGGGARRAVGSARSGVAVVARGGAVRWQRCVVAVAVVVAVMVEVAAAAAAVAAAVSVRGGGGGESGGERNPTAPARSRWQPIAARSVQKRGYDVCTDGGAGNLPSGGGGGVVSACPSVTNLAVGAPGDGAPTPGGAGGAAVWGVWGGWWTAAVTPVSARWEGGRGRG